MSETYGQTPRPTPAASPAPPGSAPGGVQLSQLSKSFRTPQGPVHAVRELEVSIAPGETVALLGPNGAGKSTTIDMLLGLSDPDRGSVRVFGRDPHDAVAHGQVGAMLQTGGLLTFVTVRELLDTVASFYPNPMPADDVMRITGIAEFANRRTEKLSGGQTQRVRAALALVSNPDLLVLDEPTVAMDVEGRHTFWEAVRGFAQGGKTVLFATHYLEEADQYADRIILMARGRVVADGPANEIKASAGGRTIRATLPGADLAALGKLPGVAGADSRGESVILSCPDSDTAIRALLSAYPAASDIEISSAGLEAAFLSLTGDTQDEMTQEQTA